jgi:hypothetical protein
MQIEEEKETEELQLKKPRNPAFVKAMRNRLEEPKYILSEESAMDVLAGFLTYYGISTEDVAEMEGSLEWVMKGIRLTKIDIQKEDKGKPIVCVSLASGSILRFENSPVKAKALYMTQPPQGQENKFNMKVYQVAGSMTGLGEQAIMSIHPADLQFIEAVTMVFLGL